MATRIADMRTLLKKELQAAGSGLNWDKITDQIGMFAFTGLTPSMCDELMEK
jgi:aspartate aminotransferase